MIDVRVTNDDQLDVFGLEPQFTNWVDYISLQEGIPVFIRMWPSEVVIQEQVPRPLVPTKYDRANNLGLAW